MLWPAQSENLAMVIRDLPFTPQQISAWKMICCVGISASMRWLKTIVARL